MQNVLMTENYASMWFVNCTSDQKPGIVDSDGKTPIISATEIYSGCYGKASINFFHLLRPVIKALPVV